MSQALVTSENASSAQAKRGRERGFLPVFVLLTIVAAGVGAVVGMQLVSQTRETILRIERGQKTSEVSPLYPEAGHVRSLKAVVVNLAAPADIFVRLQSSIVLTSEALPEASVIASRIEGDMASYLRTITLAQLEGAGGLQHLREDLNDRAKTRSNGSVQELIIESVVVQ